jgi:hypothetical protein
MEAVCSFKMFAPLAVHIFHPSFCTCDAENEFNLTRRSVLSEMNTSRWMRCAGYAACIGDMRNEHKVLVGKQERTGHSGCLGIDRSKVKQSLYTPWRRLEERRYSSYSFTTSALDGSEWSASRPGRALPPGKGPPVPIVQEAVWAPEPVLTQRLEEKSSAPAGDRTPIARSSSP